MKTLGVLGGLAALSLAFAVGCGDDSGGSGGSGGKGGAGGSGAASDAGSGGDEDAAGSDAGGTNAMGGSAGSTAGSGGAMGGSGGAAGSAGAGGSGGSDMPPTFKSQPAGITLELDAASKDLGLTLASTSITQDTTGSLNYVEWLGELYNGSDETQCLIAITGDFQTAAGATVTKLMTYAKGPAYDLGSLNLSSPCVAPGERVPVWTNDLPTEAIALGTIAKLVLSVDPIASPNAVIHPSTPTFTPVQKVKDGSEWQVSTTATSVANIYNVGVTFWGKSGDFYVDNANDYHLEDFLKGSTWSIDTAPLGLETATLSEVVTYFDFIDGLKGSAARRVYDEPTSALLSVRDSAISKWDAAKARRERARDAR